MPRFSLASLLLLTAVVGLTFALLVGNIQRRDDDAELSELRNLAGRLTVTDPDLVHAIPVPMAGALKWQWQIYLPPDKDYELVLIAGDIPESGIPKRWSARTGFRKSGKFLLTASVEKDRHGNLILATEAQGQNLNQPVANENWGGHQYLGLKNGETTVGDAEQPLVLSHIRASKSVDPPYALMILIEEYKE